jgi:uncharacterized protein (TIGR00251 family)
MKINLSVKVTPNASRERIVYDEQGMIKIYVMAPAIEGKANAAVIALCAKKLGIAKKNISIEEGEKGRFKIISIESPFEEELLLKHLGLEVQTTLL